ncbi:AmmeMemoRadiSam system protein B [Acidobacteriia bacterium AH_259_A11_L15]|nr:AmmeMemoRadiSam system protein B [Acidobacteriia bacterium AH_259_A11_L15]
MHRRPAVAGHFYPARPQELTRDLERYIERVPTPGSAVGCLVPHAGMMYSGHVAGAVYGRLQAAQSYIILCPNHRGLGHPFAINCTGEWETPLGNVPIDTSLATELKQAYARLEDNAEAHRLEHSLEVQLPFLQHLQGSFRFVPIALSVGSYEPLEELGHAIARVMARREPRALLVASSDLNHYDPDPINRQKDRRVIDRLLELDPRGLYDTVRREGITMCGYEPGVVLLTAARDLGAHSAELIRYATSADAGGDPSGVVGYAGIIIR